VNSEKTTSTQLLPAWVKQMRVPKEVLEDTKEAQKRNPVASK
jgi:hypothetical protein